MKDFLKILGYFLFPVLVLLIHAFFVIFGLYSIYEWIDIPMHFLGGMSVAVSFTLTLRSFQKQNLMGKMPFLIFLIFVVSLTALTAVFWEFWEFFADLYMELNAQLGLADTMADLFLGLIGGLFGFLFTYKSLKNSNC